MEESLILYRCKNCKLIITSSIYLLEDKPEWNLRIFKKAAVRKSETWETSASSYNQYCSYFTLLCPSCDIILGKHYKSLTKALCKYYNTAFLDYENIEVLSDYGIKRAKPTPSFTFEPTINEEILTTMTIEKEFYAFNPFGNNIVLFYYSKEY